MIPYGGIFGENGILVSFAGSEAEKAGESLCAGGIVR